MSDLFSTFGTGVRSSLTNFAQTASGEIINEVSVVVYTGILIYFTVKAYLISSGRSEGAISELIVFCGKVSLIAFFALNAGNFATYVIPAVYGIESSLIGALSHAAGAGDMDSSWGIVDATWETFMQGWMAIQNIWNKTSWGMFGDSIGVILFIGVMIVLVLGVSIYFTFFAVGYLLLYEIFLVMGLSFGPLFLCTLMFPTTRSWFDGWLRAVVCWAFTLVAITGTLLLIDGIFFNNVNELQEVALQAQKGKDFSFLLMKLSVFSVLVLAIATVVKSIPSFAAAITGGVALQAASVAGMLSGMGRTLAGTAGGAMLGYGAATHNDELREKARNVLGSAGLTNPGSFASASLGYTVGLPMSLFGSGDSEPSKPNNLPPSQTQTPQEEAIAAKNAAYMGMPNAFGNTGSDSSGSSSTSSSNTMSSHGPASFGSGSSQMSGTSASSTSSFNYSDSGSSFSSSGTFGTNGNAPQASVPSVSGSSESTMSAQEIREERTARENERKVDEYLRNRGKGE